MSKLTLREKAEIVALSGALMLLLLCAMGVLAIAMLKVAVR